jgi:hypothetical protein
MIVDLPGFVRLLSGADVDYIIIGGVAGALHGAARSTYDLDIVYSRSQENVARLVAALNPVHPYLRGAPPNLPFVFDAATVKRGLNFTLTTDLGDLDLLGEVVGGGGFDALLPFTDSVDLEGFTCRVLALPKLIAIKRAAGRPKDHDAIAELEALAEESGRLHGSEPS